MIQGSSSSAPCVRVIVVGNEKGGSGKSTVAVHLAVALLKLGQSVATIDLDSRQRSFTHYIDNRLAWARQRGKELPAPISDEFRRVVQEMQIGIPMEVALANLLRRIPSEDLDFVITAINVQREVGGNLSEILDTISFTIRERVKIKGEIRVITSQVRASGTILALIPFKNDALYAAGAHAVMQEIDAV